MKDWLTVLAVALALAAALRVASLMGRFIHLGGSNEEEPQGS